MTPQNFVAEVNGHHIYRDGDKCHLWTAGVGWWGFDMTEDEARTTCASVADPLVAALGAAQEPQR